MSHPPDIEKALAALEEEVGYLVRRRSTRPRAISPRTGRPFVRWAKLYEWCKKNPGVEATLEGVYTNASYRLRKQYPDLRVEGSNHHIDEATGIRVCDTSVIYMPPDA